MSDSLVRKRIVVHKSVVRPGPFGGTLTTTLCGRMRNQDDGMNVGVGFEVTCKFCLKEIARRAKIAGEGDESSG